MMVTSYPVQRAGYPVLYKEITYIYTLILHIYVYLPDSDPNVYNNSENFQFIVSGFTHNLKENK